MFRLRFVFIVGFLVSGVVGYLGFEIAGAAGAQIAGVIDERRVFSQGEFIAGRALSETPTQRNRTRSLKQEGCFIPDQCVDLGNARLNQHFRWRPGADAEYV
jgi:hypothetical protein